MHLSDNKIQFFYFRFGCLYVCVSTIDKNQLLNVRRLKKKIQTGQSNTDKIILSIVKDKQ